MALTKKNVRVFFECVLHVGHKEVSEASAELSRRAGDIDVYTRTDTLKNGVRQFNAWYQCYSVPYKSELQEEAEIIANHLKVGAVEVHVSELVESEEYTLRKKPVKREEEWVLEG